MKFKVGDRVKVIKEGSHQQNIGDIGCIKGIYNEPLFYCVTMDKDNDFWWFKEDEIELVKYTFEDFKKAPKGTKVTFENGETLMKKYETNYEYENVFEGSTYARNYHDLRDFEDNWETKKLGKIVKIEEPTGYREVYRNKEEVKEMSLAEVCKELEYNVKIVKEEE